MIQAETNAYDILKSGDRCFTIERDPGADIITVSAHGFWSPSTAETYFRELRSFTATDRAENRDLRVLVDKRGAPVHAQDTMIRLQQLFETFYRKGDKVAAIVDSSLVKLQFRRIYDDAICQPFLSVSAARNWLAA